MKNSYKKAGLHRNVESIFAIMFRIRLVLAALGPKDAA